MKTTRQTISRILAMLAFRCPGRDPLTEISKNSGSDADDMKESLLLFWLDQLRDLDEGVLLAATRDLCGAPGQWSPSVGDIRQRAVELSMGNLAPPTAGDAWFRVCEWSSDRPVELTPDEKDAVARIGGQFELKHTENLAATRAHFLRFYDELVKKRVMTRRAHPETRELAENNQPKKIEEYREPHNQELRHNDAPTMATKEEVRKLLDGLSGYRAMEDA